MQIFPKVGHLRSSPIQRIDQTAERRQIAGHPFIDAEKRRTGRKVNASV